MKQNLTRKQREFVLQNPTRSYSELMVVSRVFKKPVDKRDRVFREVSDEDIAWEVDLAIDLELQVIKPLLRIPAMRRAG